MRQVMQRAYLWYVVCYVSTFVKTVLRTVKDFEPLVSAKFLKDCADCRTTTKKAGLVRCEYQAF